MNVVLSVTDKLLAGGVAGAITCTDLPKAVLYPKYPKTYSAGMASHGGHRAAGVCTSYLLPPTFYTWHVWRRRRDLLDSCTSSNL